MGADAPMELQVGQTRTIERTFSTEQIRDFAVLSGDRGAHHLEQDAEGRLMAHGLLVATLPTEVGGEMNFLARDLRFEFLRPVWSGDTIRCTVRVAALETLPHQVRLSSEFECANQRGELVMRGTARGVVRT